MDEVLQDETLGESLSMYARCPNKNDEFNFGLGIPCNQLASRASRVALRMTNIGAIQQLL